MSAPERLDADIAAMARLSRALVFVCGQDHPVTVAMRKAVASGSPQDIDKARALFTGLKPGLRRAAETIMAS